MSTISENIIPPKTKDGELVEVEVEWPYEANEVIVYHYNNWTEAELVFQVR